MIPLGGRRQITEPGTGVVMREGFEAKPGDSFEKAPADDVRAHPRVALGRIATRAALAKDASTRTALGRAAVSETVASGQEKRAEAARSLGRTAINGERRGRA